MEEEKSDIVEKYFREFMKNVDNSIRESTNVENYNVNLKNIRDSEYLESHNVSKDILIRSNGLYNFYKKNMNVYDTRLFLSLIYYGVFLILYSLSKMFIFIPLGYKFTIIIETFIQLVFLTLAYFVVNSCALNNVKNEIEHEINRYNNLLKKNNDDVNKIYNNKTNSVLNDIKNSISNYISYTKEFVPILNNYITALNKRSKCHRILDNIIALLFRYSIINNDLSKNISRVKETLPNYDDDKEILSYYISKISSIIDIEDYVIELLYFDYIGDLENKNRIWQFILNDSIRIIFLINALIKYNLISTTIINKEVQVAISYNLKDFSLQKLQWGFTNASIFNTYIHIIIENIKMENLIKNNIMVSHNYIFQSNIPLYNSELEINHQYKAIYNICQNIILEYYVKIDGIIEAFMVQISAKKMDWLVQKSCITASYNDNSISILFKHLIMSERYDDKYITLKDVIDSTDIIIYDLMNDRKILKEQIKISLRDGTRIKSIPNLIKLQLDNQQIQLDRIEKRQIETQIKSEEIEEKEKAIKYFANNYLSQKTITQVLESKTIMAFIILFSRPEFGSVRDELEYLKKINRSKLWFENYTNSSRLGLIPPDMSFLEISNIFYEHFREKNLNTNIVIHRFTLSEFNTTQIPLGDVHEPPWKILRRLIVHNLKPNQIRLYLKYGEFIEESFYNKHFYDIIKDYLDENIRDNKINDIIKNKDILPLIYESMNMSDMKNLLKLVLNTKNDQVIKHKLNGILLKEYSELDNNLINKLSDEFYIRLKSYAIVSQEIF